MLYYINDIKLSINEVEKPHTNKRKRIMCSTYVSLLLFQVLKMYGRELCIVVTNVSMMTAEYCHPKTTPDLPVRDAVCMSMAIPG